MKILVLAPTGTQGTPTVRELLNAGHEVSGFTLTNGSKAERLRQLGVDVICGNLLDQEALYQAMMGKDAVVFIPALPTAGNPIPEFTVGFNAVMAAERAGVKYMVHTSVDRAGTHESFERWGKDFWTSYRMYWIGKSAVLDLIKASKIPHWTILKPAYMMDSFLPPKVMGMYPQLKYGKIVSARLSETKVAMICADDMGKLIAKIFEDFSVFEGKEIDLAGDSVNMEMVGSIISKVTGKAVVAVSKTREELMADPEVAGALEELYKDYEGVDGKMALTGLIDACEWDNIDGYTADVEKSNGYGVKLSTFEEWAERHKNEFFFV